MTEFDPTVTIKEAEPAQVIEVGREYRVLPNSRNVDGETWLSLAGVTRVRVTDGPDDDGDYFVVALDGARQGNAGWVAPRYLAPIGEPAQDATPAASADGLDARRVAALAKARELCPNEADVADLIRVAVFLLGEKVSLWP